MAILLLDPDSMETTITYLQSCRGEIAREIESVSNSVEAMTSFAWIGPGSVDYRSDFETWHIQMLHKVNDLDVLIRGLNSELLQWQQTGARFGKTMDYSIW